MSQKNMYCGESFKPQVATAPFWYVWGVGWGHLTPAPPSWPSATGFVGQEVMWWCLFSDISNMLQEISVWH